MYLRHFFLSFIQIAALSIDIMSGSNSSSTIAKQNVHLFNVIPIESFGHKRRFQIVNLSITFLNGLIFGYNKIFRASDTIIRVISICIFLFVYSIIPCFALLLSLLLSSYLLEMTLSELLFIAFEQRLLLVAFGCGFLLFYAAEIIGVIYFGGQRAFDSVEAYLMHECTDAYSTSINVLREQIISTYRETGWDVLGLIVNQQRERAEIMRSELMKNSRMPADVIGIIETYLLDKDLSTLSKTRYNKEKRQQGRDNQSMLKPHDIFKMYSSLSTMSE